MQFNVWEAYLLIPFISSLFEIVFEVSQSLSGNLSNSKNNQSNILWWINYLSKLRVYQVKLARVNILVGFLDFKSDFI